MPDKPLSKGLLLADLKNHSGYPVLMEIFESLLKHEEDVLWTSPGPEARALQVEAVVYMKALFAKAKIKIENSIKDAQVKERLTNVQETQRTGRRCQR